MEEKTAHEYEMFSCLQNTDGRQGDASGRTKNSEQSSVQQLKAQRNQEATGEHLKALLMIIFMVVLLIS